MDLQTDAMLIILSPESIRQTNTIKQPVNEQMASRDEDGNSFPKSWELCYLNQGLIGSQSDK